MSEPICVAPCAPVASEAPLVLVADDDEVIVGLISYRLEHSGYRVIAALDGQEALRLALTEHPALAVIDVMMPGIDGYELTRRLRGDEATRLLPIILLTAQAQETDSDRGFEAGADAYVVKPFSPEELRSLVAELLARADPRSDGRRAGRSGQAVA